MDPFEITSDYQLIGAVTVVPQTQPTTVNAGADRGRLLVMEDDPVQLRLLEQHLTSVGFQVATASTIQAAKQLLKSQKIELAIFDIQLPDGCGFELCQTIDNQPEHAGLPVIVLSSLSEASAVRKTRASGGRYFLSKPYDPNVLLAIIERALEDRLT